MALEKDESFLIPRKQEQEKTQKYSLKLIYNEINYYKIRKHPSIQVVETGRL